MIRNMQYAESIRTGRSKTRDERSNVVRDILALSGIAINGGRPWDIQVVNEKFFDTVLGEGSLGLGESYMAGWWNCERLDEFFARIIPSRPEEKIKRSLKNLLYALGSRVINKGSKARAFEIGERHYDLGNELYRNMLDRRMVYSCAYWKNAETLDDAQEAKLDLICRKLAIEPGQKILDIGCGWGSFAKYASERYGAQVTGITVSREQAKYAEELCAGLPVTIKLQDYREDTGGRFDHIVSVGMFEHVGPKNYRAYLQSASRCLKDDGLFLLHTIGGNETRAVNDPWMEKYIFPNSLIPSMAQISDASEGLFVVEDWHNFGSDYDATLMSWFERFDANWNSLKDKYDARFYRMWKYYLLSCAAAFRTRHLQVWQIVLSKRGVPGGYCAVR
jgi:cyclopropane-fatty-acyl-phospholipid synthase